MSELKHTPGPWHINPSWGPCEEHPEWASIDIGPDYVCVSGHIGAANARLIAAAPDLLKALQAITQQTNSTELSEALDLSRAAISKATGAE